MPFPFEVSFEAVEADLDTFVDAVFGSLHSDFLTMPKGEGFVEYPVFERGYEVLKRATRGFRDLTPETVIDAVYKRPSPSSYCARYWGSPHRSGRRSPAGDPA